MTDIEALAVGSFMATAGIPPEEFCPELAVYERCIKWPAHWAWLQLKEYRQLRKMDPFPDTTKRDWIAMSALSGDLAAYIQSNPDMDVVVDRAYRRADAMMERSKK